MGFDQSPYRPKSMLNKALILYKTSSAEKSSTILKKLILGYPKDNITPQAHRLSMQIAIDNGDVNQYLLWLKKNNINYYSGDDIRSSMYDYAEVLYNSNKKKQAKKELIKKLKIIINGAFKRNNLSIVNEFSTKLEYWDKVNF